MKRKFFEKVQATQHSESNVKSSNLFLFSMTLWANIIFAGIIYDVIVEPPSVGSTTDEFGHSKPVSSVTNYSYNVWMCFQQDSEIQWRHYVMC